MIDVNIKKTDKNIKHLTFIKSSCINPIQFNQLLKPDKKDSVINIIISEV